MNGHRPSNHTFERRYANHLDDVWDYQGAIDPSRIDPAKAASLADTLNSRVQEFTRLENTVSHFLKAYLDEGSVGEQGLKDAIAPLQKAFHTQLDDVIAMNRKTEGMPAVHDFSSGAYGYMENALEKSLSLVKPLRAAISNLYRYRSDKKDYDAATKSIAKYNQDITNLVQEVIRAIGMDPEEFCGTSDINDPATSEDLRTLVKTARYVIKNYVPLPAPSAPSASSNSSPSSVPI